MNPRPAGRDANPERLDILWGAKAIARYLGCGVDFVYGLREEPAGPIRKSRGKLFAFRDDLARYLRAANDP